jgi:hypothetical protein
MTNWKTTDFQSVNINYSNKAEGNAKALEFVRKVNKMQVLNKKG